MGLRAAGGGGGGGMSAASSNEGSRVDAVLVRRTSSSVKYSPWLT